MSSALCLFHQLHIAGGAELAPEVAGIAGIDVDHIGCPQGQCIFQFIPVMDVNAGNVLGFHGRYPTYPVSVDSNDLRYPLRGRSVYGIIIA